MQRAVASVMRGVVPFVTKRTILVRPVYTFPFILRYYASKPKSSDSGYLPNYRKKTIQPNDQIDVFEWPIFRQWTRLETNGFNIAQRFIREWKYFLPEVMTIADTEGQDEFGLLSPSMQRACDSKITKDFILAGEFDTIHEDVRPLFTALNQSAKLEFKGDAGQHLTEFSNELLKLVNFPSNWTTEYAPISYSESNALLRANREIDMQLGQVNIPGGECDSVVFDDKGRILMGVTVATCNPGDVEYFTLNHSPIMGFSLAFCKYNSAFEPQGERQEPQEQEVFFWNIKNQKVGLIRVTADLSVLKQLKNGQCPQTRTALCVWPMKDGYDFFEPEERKKFFVDMARVKKHLLSGNAFVGPKTVDPVERARKLAEAATALEAAKNRKPTFLPPGQAPSADLLQAITPDPIPQRTSSNATTVPAAKDNKQAK